MPSPLLTDSKHLSELPAPEVVAQELSHLPGFVFLDSSSAGGEMSPGEHERFSLLTACPSRILKGNLFDDKGFTSLQNAFQKEQRPAQSTPDLGFPTDGLYGTVSYDGDYVFGEYSECLIFDHCQQSWLEMGSLSQQRKPISPTLEKTSVPDAPLVTGVSREKFCSMVQQAQEYIAAGDIYQVNLAHQFSTKVTQEFDCFALYLRLREQSPAPYAAYLNQKENEIISSSPEQFLSISGRTIQTRPIKGTRPRFRDREKDEKSAYDLITSSKEVAELIMITDLERNDLGQICEFGSVEATELLKLERFAQVFHLISTVEGTLRREVGPVEALQACFPGGSITGAPKKRAREIIDELEPVGRGIYTGAIGCLGFNGESRFSIAIRTAIRENDKLHFHVGAGIVADSDPEKEWEETLHKAAGILQACEQSEA